MRSILAAVTALTVLTGIMDLVKDPPDHTVKLIDGVSYTLTFEDNFDGTELDLTKWERCPEWKRQDLNNYWDDSMSYLDGKGNLVIAMEHDEESDRYISGAVRSKGLFEQAYGYFEIRCVVNNIPGYWTAFWLMGESVGNENGTGTDGTEIDIMESAYATTGEINHALHWDGYGEAHRSLGQRSQANVYDGKYHTFSLLWTEDIYIFYIDGEEAWRTDAAQAGGVCEVPLYLKITAETGSWMRNPPPDYLLPNGMKVDYVRVYCPKS